VRSLFFRLTLKLLLPQVEGIMQGAHGQLGIFLFNEAGDFNFRGANHQNVDVFVEEDVEGLGGNAGVVAHAHADDGDFANVGVMHDFHAIHAVGFGAFDNAQGFFKLLACDGESHVGDAVAAGVLHNHIHGDIGLGEGAENAGGDAGFVGAIAQRNAGLISVECNSGDENVFHFFILLNEHGTRGVAERRAHVHGHFIFFGEFDGADFEHFGAHAGHFQHFVISNAVQFSCIGGDVGVRRINPIHIRIYVTPKGIQRGGEGDSGGIRAAASQSADAS